MSTDHVVALVRELPPALVVSAIVAAVGRGELPAAPMARVLEAALAEHRSRRPTRPAAQQRPARVPPAPPAGPSIVIRASGAKPMSTAGTPATAPRARAPRGGR